MKCKYFVLSFIALLILSCSGNSSFRQAVRRAESLKGEYPDSALQLLQGLQAELPNAGKSERMRYLLILTELRNSLYLSLPDDSTFLEVVDYYDKEGSCNERMKAYYLLGSIYRDMNEAPIAIKTLYKAIECADTTDTECDYVLLMKTYGQLSDIYDSQIMPLNELETLEQYRKYASVCNDDYNSILGSELMIRAYNLLGDTASVLRTTDDVYKQYLCHGYKEQAAKSLVSAIYVHLQNGDFRKADVLMGIYERESGVFDSDGNVSRGKEHYYYGKGLYYMGVDILDSAEIFFRKLLVFGYDYDAYSGLLKVYERKAVPDSIAELSGRKDKAFDAEFTNKSTYAMYQAKSMYDYERNENIALRKSAEAERSKVITIFIAALCLLIIIAGAVVFWKYRSRKMREIANLSIHYLSLIEQNIKTKEELRLLKENHSALVATKQAELSINSVRLERCSSAIRDLSFNDRIIAIKSSRSYKEVLMSLDPKLKHLSASYSNLDELVLVVERFFPDFRIRVSTPDRLQRQEELVAVLCLLGASSGEMSILLEVSPQRITNIKKAVNAKLFGEESAKTLVSNLKTMFNGV